VCDQHGILLIFDEVITGFGRIGARFAANRFGVQPDIITCAKGLSNGAVPIGATIVSKAIHDAYMENSREEIELAHGYTYSGHPLACAAAIATIRLFDEEGLWTRVTALEGAFESAMHGLKEQKLVTDVRNIGLLAGIDLAPVAGQRGARAKRIADLCFDRGVLVRSSGDTLVISPPLIIEVGQIDLIATTIAGALDDCT
jgi:beta-alanine--pyruvate transaminase